MTIYPHSLRSAGCLPWTAWLAACSGLFMLIAGVALWHRWDFAFQDQSGIVGWVTVNRYPKQLELIAFIGAIGAMVLGVLTGPLFWWWLARQLARRRGLHPVRVLRCLGLASAGLLIGLVPLLLGHWSVWWQVGLPFGATAAMAAMLLRQPLIAAYLEAHYAPAKVIDGNALWLRRDLEGTPALP